MEVRLHSAGGDHLITLPPEGTVADLKAAAWDALQTAAADRDALEFLAGDGRVLANDAEVFSGV